MLFQFLSKFNQRLTEVSRTKTNWATVRRPFCYFLSTEHLAVCLPDDVTIPRVLCLSSRFLKKGTLSEFVMYSLRFQEKYEFDIRGYWKNLTLKANQLLQGKQRMIANHMFKILLENCELILTEKNKHLSNFVFVPNGWSDLPVYVWKCYLISVPLISSAGDFIFLKNSNKSSRN